MIASIPELLEAVKDAIDAGTFSLSFTPERVYVTLRNLPELQTALSVMVVLQDSEYSRLMRSEISTEATVQVVVRKKITGDAQTTAANVEVDALMELVAEIMQWLTPKNGFDDDGNVGDWTYLRSTNTPPYDAESLISPGVFLSIVQVSFKA